VPCDILGIPEQGRVAPGQVATLVATDRPLLDGRSRVLHAWVRGEKIDLTDRQKNLYERYRRRALTRPGSAGDNQPMIPNRLPDLPAGGLPQRPRPAGDFKPDGASPPRESYEPGVPAQGWSFTGDVRYHEVHSKTLGNSRQVWVYLPPNYAQNSDKRYPVVYAMDGQNLFERGTAHGGQEWGMDEAAQRAMSQGSMQEAIIVAVSNAKSDRLKEYSPVPDPKHGGGGAEDFARFLKTELKPMIDGAYRTEGTRESTAVLGSSMGGLVSLYMGLAHADTFGLIGALSPSLWWAQQHMLEQWKSNPPVQRPEKVWMDMGDRESDSDQNSNGIPDTLDHTRALHGVLASQGQQGLMYHEIPGGTHSEGAWAGRIQHVLESLLPPENHG
jgi:predicted alpha/beta superfamily hydrolase